MTPSATGRGVAWAVAEIGAVCATRSQRQRHQQLPAGRGYGARQVGGCHGLDACRTTTGDVCSGVGPVVASREPGCLSWLVLIERGGAVCIVGESGASLSGSDLIAADRQSGDPDSVARRWSSTRRGDTASRSTAVRTSTTPFSSSIRTGSRA
jgi:hypothetical protein